MRGWALRHKWRRMLWSRTTSGMKSVLIIVAIFCLLLYLGITHLYTGAKDVQALPRKGSLEHLSGFNSSRLRLLQEKLNKISAEDSAKHQNFLVYDIWSKASVGKYLWEHVLHGSYLQESSLYSYGELEIEEIQFRFHTGPGLTFDSIRHSDTSFENILLVINTVGPVSTARAEQWFNFTLTALPSLRNIGILLHGNESCDNSWIEQHFLMQHDRGIEEKDLRKKLRFMFVVYDTPLADGSVILQWPLGVATYRNFPVQPEHIETNTRRRYRCNFIGTVYQNSSREVLYRILKDINVEEEQCLVKARLEWVPLETNESLSSYVEALKASDLTLSPAGKNTECYRIYEAIAYGSVPVIEDRATCDRCSQKYSGSARYYDGKQIENFSNHEPYPQGPLRLLKQYGAPVIYVKNWNELPALLKTERTLSLTQIIQRRKRLVAWYKQFKEAMKKQLLSVIRERTIAL